MGGADIVRAPGRGNFSGAAYWELLKPRITTLVVLTAAAGFYLGAGKDVGTWVWLHCLVGVFLLAGGTAVLNQVLERESDGRMQRTRLRPIPSGRLAAGPATLFGLALVGLGTLYLALLTQPLAALLGAGTALLYLLAYTPLKQRTSLCTAVGAIPGAMPPLIGWAAARGSLDLDAFLLFAILFAWQFPHFLAIAWIYREDYLRGGFRMLPLNDLRGKRTARRILLFSILLWTLSVTPSFSGLAGELYLAGALAIGLALVGLGVHIVRDCSRNSARHLLRATVAYLPLLLILMVLDKVD